MIAMRAWLNKNLLEQCTNVINAHKSDTSLHDMKFMNTKVRRNESVSYLVASVRDSATLTNLTKLIKLLLVRWGGTRSQPEFLKANTSDKRQPWCGIALDRPSATALQNSNFKHHKHTMKFRDALLQRRGRMRTSKE